RLADLVRRRVALLDEQLAQARLDRDPRAQHLVLHLEAFHELRVGDRAVVDQDAAEGGIAGLDLAPGDPRGLLLEAGDLLRREEPAGDEDFAQSRRLRPFGAGGLGLLDHRLPQLGGGDEFTVQSLLAEKEILAVAIHEALASYPVASLARES